MKEVRLVSGAELDARLAENESFEAWLDEVDSLVQQLTGLGFEDFADICYRDLYDAGCLPDGALEELAMQDSVFAEFMRSEGYHIED